MNFIDSLFDKLFVGKFADRIFGPFERMMDSDNFDAIFQRAMLGFLTLSYVCAWILAISAIFLYGFVTSGFVFAIVLVFFLFLGRYCYLHVFKE